MKLFIVFAALFAVAFAAPRPEGTIIVRNDADVGTESFKYGYETSDGSKAEASGQLNNIGTDNEALAVHGSFSFVSDNGITYTINYIADENGYQPEGSHLPVSP